MTNTPRKKSLLFLSCGVYKFLNLSWLNSTEHGERCVHAWGGSLEEAHFSGTGNKLDFTAVSHLGCKVRGRRSCLERVLGQVSLSTPCGEVQRGLCCLNFQEEEKSLPGARAVRSAWLLCDIILDLKIQDCLKTLSRLVGVIISLQLFIKNQLIN